MCKSLILYIITYIYILHKRDANPFINLFLYKNSNTYQQFQISCYLITICLNIWFCLFKGFYMYIETSRPRLEGEKARLLSPVFSIAPKNPYGPTNTAYCFSFFYHMYGQHIGEVAWITMFLLLKYIITEKKNVYKHTALIHFSKKKMPSLTFI